MSLVQKVQVAVNAPLADVLTYLQNDLFEVKRGQLVYVPLGKRKAKGVVVNVISENQTIEQEKVIFKDTKFNFKKIDSIDNEWPELKDPFLKWIEWVADYYIYPLGQVVQLCYPPLGRPKTIRKSLRKAVIPEVSEKKQHHLTDEQIKCISDIQKIDGFATHLIHGVTGSGKTEIYLQLFAKVLEQKKKGLFLIPEIALTPQLIFRFAERFGNRIAVLHSQLTDRERTHQWCEIIEGNKEILIGARSALFCPVDNLGLIVVDEEHETSYKQDEKLKYNGRDCAVMLGRFMNCPVILGSATPSLESWKNALDKKYFLHQLKNRVENRPLPEIEIVDMRLEKDLEKKSIDKPYWLSQKLYEEMIVSLEKKHQIALLLNRRGLAHMLFCPECGYSVDCPNCDISLTLHSNSHLVCHYCDYHENAKTKCPDCKEGQLITMGLGTEKVEEDLKKMFPLSKVARADRDEVQSRLQMEELVQDMENRKIDILVGTQMIAKGLDFTYLKLVGLILADVSFNLPDFRASEKSFQLITQMSGRSGRHLDEFKQPGKVIIQTYNTENESVQFSQRHDFEGFAQNELQYRNQLNYPPIHKLASIRIQSVDLEKAKNSARQFTERSFALKGMYPLFEMLEILGPAVAPIAKLRNQYRFHVLIKGAQSKIINQFLRMVVADSKWLPSQTRILIDIDPQNLL